MPVIHYDNKDYFAEDGETVLDCLLRQGADFPHSCKIGTCQSCMAESIKGDIPPRAQEGLKPTLVAKNYFLTCQCTAEKEITIALPDQESASVPAKISKLAMLNHNIMQVILEIHHTREFMAGQYINLITEENIIRSYSIASVTDKYLELHVKLMPSGKISRWLQHDAKLGISVHVRGPIGDCFYFNPDHSAYPIVLAGTGTGLAPLIGIANDALASNHVGDIILVHGGVNQADLYQDTQLKNLQKKHANFRYVPCVLENSSSAQQGAIDQILVEQLKSIASNTQLFICGPQETTKKMKTKAFLAGVPSSAIHSDAFC